MMISPKDIKNKTFSLTLRGYAKGEVDEYMARVAEDYASLAANYEALLQKNRELEASLAEMKENEDAIRRALVNSQSAAQKVIEEAKERGEELETLAKEKCGEVIAKFRDQIRIERERLNTLRAQVTNFRARIFEQYQSHIETVEAITKALEEDDWDMTPTDATRSVLALLRGDFDRRTRMDEIEEQKIDREIDIVIDKISRNKKGGE